MNVSLFDRYKGAWEKPCGGGVPPKVRERFAEIAAYDGAKRAVDVGNFVSPKGIAVRLLSQRPMWVVSRKDFDGYLRKLAKQAGVIFRHERIRHVEQRNGTQTVVGKNESQRANSIPDVFTKAVWDY